MRGSTELNETQKQQERTAYTELVQEIINEYLPKMKQNFLHVYIMYYNKPPSPH